MLEDPLFWIFVLPGLLLGAYAQSRIKINIAKYSQIGTQDGITGAQVARRLLDSQGLRDIAVESTPGMLSDHYDPRSKTLRLSQEVYFAPSVAAAGITLPVEFNASARAQELLTSQGIIRGDEQIAGVQKVLGAAAWTYVAADVAALGSWLFYVVLLISQTRSTSDRS